MKLDPNKPPTKFAARAMCDFTNAMLDLLHERDMEHITVGELCERANYPRATFYNYFEDIYDLLRLCWTRVATDMRLDDYASISMERRTRVLFERVYTYLDDREDSLSLILAHNRQDGRMMESLRSFMRERILQMVRDCPDQDRFHIPPEMVAEHYANTVQLVVEWCFLRRSPITRDQALLALDELLEER